MSRHFRASHRVLSTEEAVIDEILETYQTPSSINLAPGSAHFAFPVEAASSSSLSKTEWNRYGAVSGDADLVTTLKAKLKRENGIDVDSEQRKVMVTAGANQGFFNVVLCLTDPGDEVVLLRPYYFSHKMAVQLASAVPVEVDMEVSTMVPTLENIERSFSDRTQVLVLVTPGNPSGVVLDPAWIRQLEQICRERGVWLICDEAYEHFVYGEARHYSPRGSDGVINIFTMSKTFGLAGWRVGYIVYPDYLDPEMRKIQDTIPTHSSRVSQDVAKEVLESPWTDWIRARVAEIEKDVRPKIWDSIKDFHPVPSQGAFYFLVPVPRGLSDKEVLEVLCRKHNVLVVPGSAFGVPGYIRISYGALKPGEEVDRAAQVLRIALGDLWTGHR